MPHDHETIRRALSHCDPNCDRETWVRLAMAVKAELGEAGFAVWDEWSSAGETYRARDALATWRSVSERGGVGVGTLFELAKARGFVFEAQGGAVRRPTKEERAAAKAAQAEREARERAERDARQQAAAEQARARWERAKPEGRSPYLARKAVRAHGCKYGPAGALLVPMRDGEGSLWNLQRIEANGEKFFEAGARVSGLWHLLGDASAADALVIGEGYATCAALFESAQAEGLRVAVAVAFTAGNVPHVAKALRKAHKKAPLVLAADDDQETAARTGRNAGRDAAAKAAELARGAVIVPAPLAEGETDFCDLMRAHGRAAVAAIVGEGIEAARRAIDYQAKQAGADNEADALFALLDEGVFFRERRDGGEVLQWVCAPLRVTARTRDADSRAWGYLAEFRDPAGVEKRLAVPAAALAGDAIELRRMLLEEGCAIAQTKARQWLGLYLATRKPEGFALCVDSIGWHGENFVLPHRTFGPQAEPIVYQAEDRGRNPFREAGTLEAWRDEVAAPCVGNSLLIFAASIALAGPCLELTGDRSGGFHFMGPSSKGKSTAERVPASVYGRPEPGGFIESWRATSNGAESVAARYSGTVLVLDEIREAEPKEIAATVLMLGNEAGKARQKSGGGLRARLTWRLYFVSSGESGIEAHAARAGGTVDAGALVRLIELPAVMSESLGVFETLHGASDAASFADALRDATLRHHGTAGAAWLDYLTAHRAEAAAFMRECIAELLAEWIKPGDSGQARRVARRFAHVAAAGELAGRAGITGWPAGECERAARVMCARWLEARGTRGDAEELKALRHVATVLAERGAANFLWWHRAGEDRVPNPPMRWGLRRLNDGDTPIETNSQWGARFGTEADSQGDPETTSAEYFVLSTAFREHLCGGFDPHFVARVLVKRGHLKPESEKRLDRKERLPGIGPARVYRIAPTIFEDSAL